MVLNKATAFGAQQCTAQQQASLWIDEGNAGDSRDDLDASHNLSRFKS